MNIRKIKKKYIYTTLSVAFILLIINMIGFSTQLNTVLALITIILSLILVYKCWNNKLLFLISLFIAYSNYSICVGIYLDPTLRPIYLYPQITDVSVYGLGILMLFLFTFILTMLMERGNKSINLEKVLIRKDNRNDYIFVFLYVLLITIILLGYKVNEGGRGNPSVIYEYGNIVLITLFYYSVRNKILIKLSVFIGIIYCLISFLNGTRIEGLMCSLVLLICAFSDIKNTTICIGMIFGLILFRIIGSIRGDIVLLFSNPHFYLVQLFKDKLVFDTCTYAYFPMLCMIESFRNIDFSTRIYYLVRFLMTIVIGQSHVKDGNLIVVVKNNYFHNEGGVSMGFFYTWFKEMGCILFSSYIYIL